MRKKEVVRFLVFRTLGNFLILFAVFGFFATFGPVTYYEAKYRVDRLIGSKYKVVVAKNMQKTNEIQRSEDAEGTETQTKGGPEQSLLGKILGGEKEQVFVPKSTDFGVIIPKIGGNEKVIPNVDPSNEKEYLQALTHGIAHAKGSAFPGMNGNTYLFAHSADVFWNAVRYNAAFYLLKELEKGDEIVVFFQGKRYNYYVYDKKTVEANDIKYITANVGAGETLVLQTCWPPGTTWKRLLVFAKPKV